MQKTFTSQEEAEAFARSIQEKGGRVLAVRQSVMDLIEVSPPNKWWKNGRFLSWEEVKRKALDRQGGEEPVIDKTALEVADFITLPKGVTGTNCSNCSYNQDKVCQHPQIKGQSVNEHNCCAFWDNNGTLRGWKQEKSLGGEVRKGCESLRLLDLPDVRQEDDYSCILPGQELEGRVIGGSKARYSGEAIKISTVSGSILSVTPNHPVLTEMGFIPAGQLQEGDNLLNYVREDKTAFLSNNEKNAPTVVEKVFSSFLNISGAVSPFEEVAALAFDFHGDAEFFQGKIQVVGSYSKLGSNSISDTSEGSSQSELVRSSFKEVSLVSCSSLEFSSQRPNATSNSIMSSPNLVSSGFPNESTPYLSTRRSKLSSNLGLPHTEERCFGNGADINVSIFESPTNFTLPDLALARNLLDRHSREIVLDPIVNVERFHYDGPVYDFESPLGFIIVNKLCISNCGAASTASVAWYFGTGEDTGEGPKTLEEWKKKLGTDVEKSTSPAHIIEGLRSVGLTADGKQNMTVEDLEEATKLGMPVICPIQEYGEADKDADWDYGHYVVVIGVHMGFVFVQDPAIDNVMEGSGADNAKGRMMIDVGKWEGVWHDEDMEGAPYIHYGIVVGPAGSDKQVQNTGLVSQLKSKKCISPVNRLKRSKGDALMDTAPQYAGIGSEEAKGLVFDSVNAAGKWLANRWRNLEDRYGRKTALTMAVGMIATSPLPGNIAAIIAVAEGLRKLQNFIQRELTVEERKVLLRTKGRRKRSN